MRRGVLVLVTEVGPVRAEASGDLAVESRRLINVSESLRRMPYDKRLVEPLEVGQRIDGMCRQNSLTDRWLRGGRQQIPINRKAGLQPRNFCGTCKDGEVDCFVVVLIQLVLYWLLLQRGAGCPPVSDFGNVLQAQTSGRKATCRKVEVVIVRVLHQVTLHVHGEQVPCSFRLAIEVVRSPLEDNFAQELELVGDVRGDKEIQLSERKRCGVPFLIVAMQRDVTKPANA